MNKKIILIEDDVFINDLYVRILEKEGFTVLKALDGEAGLKLCQENPNADLVLLDVMLPKMHGVDVLRNIKRDEKMKHLTIIMMSNLGDEEVIKTTIKDGARDYIKKVHISPKELVTVVKGFIQDPNFKVS